MPGRRADIYTFHMNKHLMTRDVHFYMQVYLIPVWNGDGDVWDGDVTVGAKSSGQGWTSWAGAAETALMVIRHHSFRDL